jgi:hypothetical protein
VLNLLSLRSAIDRALIAGASQSEIARKHCVSQTALSRHRHRHLGPEVAYALGRYEEADRERLGSYGNGLLNEALDGLVRPKAQGDAAEVRAWMAEARKNLELRARLGQVIGNERVRIDVADAQKQMRVLASMDEGRTAAIRGRRHARAGAGCRYATATRLGDPCSHGGYRDARGYRSRRGRRHRAMSDRADLAAVARAELARRRSWTTPP